MGTKKTLKSSYPSDGRARVAPNNVALKTGIPAGVNNVDADILDGAADLSHTLLKGLDVQGMGPGSPADRARNAKPGHMDINSPEMS